MVVQQQYDAKSGWYWQATGEGPLRPIIVEASTRSIARQLWLSTFGDQYAQAECMTAQSASWQAECDAYRDL